jgi:hypothetical protein
MNAQDDSAAEFKSDERPGCRGSVVWDSEFELKECWCLLRIGEIGGGSSAPVREGLTGNPELGAEIHCAALVILKLPDDAGAIFVCVACA